MRWPDSRFVTRAAELTAPLVARARGWRQPQSAGGHSRDWPLTPNAPYARVPDLPRETLRTPVPGDFTARVMSRIASGAEPSIPPMELVPATSLTRRLHLLFHIAGYLWLLALAVGFAVALVRPALAFDALHALVLAIVRLLGALRQTAGELSGLSANDALLLTFAALLGGMLLLRFQLARSTRRTPRGA